MSQPANTNRPVEKTHTLLVVDDNEENRDMLSRRLLRRGYTVLAAEGGTRALEIVDSQPVDLILLDIMMPDIDGIEVLRQVRSKFAQDELPVIMTTAKDDSRDIVEALDLGANDYVTKPIDFAVVTARVKKELRGLDRARAGQQSTAQAQAAADEAAKHRAIGPGSVLRGRYRLEAVIGRGNFGIVYRGHHIELDMPVAVKVLQTKSQQNDEALTRFRIEGRAAVRVSHPNAVKVYDFDSTDDGTAYLAMELLDGKALSDEMAAVKKLDPKRALQVLEPVCRMLAEAHRQGLVHRDIKPENIFLHHTRDGEIIKVLDFGIAKLAGDRINEQNLTAEGYVLGTPAYVAPERLRNQPYGGQSDVYGIGIMAFQMLCGELPFKPNKDDPVAILMMHVRDAPPSLRRKARGLPDELYDLVMRCLDKEPDKRPDAAYLADRFAAIAATLPEPVATAPEDFQGNDDLVGPTHPLPTPTPTEGMLHRLLRRLKKVP